MQKFILDFNVLSGKNDATILSVQVRENSNVIEVIRPILNSLFFFTKRFYTHQKHKTASANKN